MISDAEVKLAALRAECDEALRGIPYEARNAVTVAIGALDLLTILDGLGGSIDARNAKSADN